MPENTDPVPQTAQKTEPGHDFIAGEIYVMNETTNARKESFTIDLQKLLFTWLRRWWIIMLCALIGAVSTMYYTMNYVTPMYRASVTIYVNNSSAEERTESISSSTLRASQQLVTTYVNMIKSDTVLRKVAEAINNPKISAAYIRKELTASQVQSTVMFNVYIADADPRMAASIANTIADIAPLCGFHDPLYFSKMFKKKYGTAPRYYLESRLSSTVPEQDSERMKVRLD